MCNCNEYICPQDGQGLQRGDENRHNSAPDSGKSLMSRLFNSFRPLFHNGNNSIFIISFEKFSTLKSSSLCGDSPANPSQFYEVVISVLFHKSLPFCFFIADNI